MLRSVILAAALVPVLGSLVNPSGSGKDSERLMKPTPPPFQTAVQAQVRADRVAPAHILSNGSYPLLLQLLDQPTTRLGMACLGNISKQTSASLVEMLWEEIHLAHVVHNIPVTQLLTEYLDHVAPVPNRSTQVGAPWNVVTEFGYLPTVWDEIAEKTVAYAPSMAYLEKVETTIFKYPALNPKSITFPAAYDRPIYLALNTWKRSVGDPLYGPIALVADKTHIEDKIFISPMDTGEYSYKCIKGERPGYKTEEEEIENYYSTLQRSFSNSNSNSNSKHELWREAEKRELGLRARTDVNCSAWKGDFFGSYSHFYHLVIPHINFWNVKLEDLFIRWYGKTHAGCVKPKPVLFPYMEADFSGAFILPETLLMVFLDYDKLFGVTLGYQVQLWVKGMKKPLAWGTGDDIGNIFDPQVGNIDGKYVPTAKDAETFGLMWKAKESFANLIANTTVKLQLHFLSAQNFRICSFCDGSGCRVLGGNHDNECMYYYLK